MNYTLRKAHESDITRLKDYKLKTIFDYASKLPPEEVKKITNYVNDVVPKQLNKYKVILVNDTIVGCVLTYEKDDGLLLDEIYLEDDYRLHGIGSDIIKNILLHNPVVYLFVYKENTKALSLYKRLGFKIIEETETRYYMKYVR